jgi:ADP-L-glycero-D-manno-heptose 6-epimerase
VRLFEGTDGFADGEQRRDFVWSGDGSRRTCGSRPPRRLGIYNVGSGRAQSFNDVARAVIAHHGRGKIQHVLRELRGSYQSHLREPAQLRSQVATRRSSRSKKACRGT